MKQLLDKLEDISTRPEFNICITCNEPSLELWSTDNISVDIEREHVTMLKTCPHCRNLVLFRYDFDRNHRPIYITDVENPLFEWKSNKNKQK